MLDKISCSIQNGKCSSFGEFLINLGAICLVDCDISCVHLRLMVALEESSWVTINIRIHALLPVNVRILVFKMPQSQVLFKGKCQSWLLHETRGLVVIYQAPWISTSNVMSNWPVYFDLLSCCWPVLNRLTGIDKLTKCLHHPYISTCWDFWLSVLWKACIVLVYRVIYKVAEHHVTF